MPLGAVSRFLYLSLFFPSMLDVPIAGAYRTAAEPILVPPLSVDLIVFAECAIPVRFSRFLLPHCRWLPALIRPVCPAASALTHPVRPAALALIRPVRPAA